MQDAEQTEINKYKFDIDDIIESLPDCFCITTDKGEIKRLNKPMAELLIINEKMAYLYNTELFFPDIEDRLEMLKKLKEKSSLKNFEIEMAKSDGTKFDASINMNSFILNDALFYFIIIRDITFKKKIETQKQQLLEQQLESERQKYEAVKIIEKTSRVASIGVVTSGFTHELNQPINSIKMAASGIMYWNENNEQKLPAPLYDLVSEIAYSTKKIEDIIRHFRSYWIDYETDSFEKINLNDCVINALSIIESRINAHNIELFVELYDKPLDIFAMNLQMELMISNLLTFSISSLDKSTKKHKFIKIVSYKDSTENYAYIEIIDNGIGLPAVHYEKIFDPFYEVNNKEDQIGLELAIVKMLVNLFGAKISAINNEYGGSTFIVLFEILK